MTDKKLAIVKGIATGLSLVASLVISIVAAKQTNRTIAKEVEKATKHLTNNQ